MTTIALDSATEVCSAALVKDGEALAGRINRSDSNHAALLPVYVQDLQAEAAERGLTVDCIVLSEGPGSYTGLRIGASLAKGLCYGAGLPLVALPTLAVIAAGAKADGRMACGTDAEKGVDVLICPMIDARRMEVYCALYDAGLHEVQATEAKVIDRLSFAEVLDGHTVYFCGNGAEKCKAVISHPNARWIDGIVPTGAQAGLLADEWMSAADRTGRQINIVEGKNIAYFEPYYLKEFIAAPSHVKGLH